MKFFRSESGKLPMIIIIVVALVLVLGIGAFAFMKMGKGSKGKHEEKKVELTSWKMEEFVVNLADQDESRYIKVNLVLEVESKGKAGGGHGESSENPEEAKARDAIISCLSKKEYDELIPEKGKEKLKEDLKTSLNEVLKESKVAEIYFTSFAMQ